MEKKYVLLTAAYNEEKYIASTINSVISQTLLPLQWIIVSDASTDKTDKIVKEYEQRYPFITLIRYENPEKITSNLGRTSKRVVACIRKGFSHLKYNDYQYIGIIDADISFDNQLIEKILFKFSLDPLLGLAGGFIYNLTSKNEKKPYFTKGDLVGGPFQMFRRECWEQIGGYYPGGHHDYFAVKSCSYYGWKACSFEELEILHMKNPVTIGANLLQVSFYLGQMDYVCGELFIYSFARVMIEAIKRISYAPRSIARIVGFLYALILRFPKQVPPHLTDYLKKEQLKKIFPFLKR